ncbi:sensor histidine kinase [Streptacidiphilus anmyonensis]|uniref:sensor histidine kinase n=1 Tax=Streptacidiphilus anmyonensis TaxID=405782 RepID=UPI000A0660D3|nr:histidine kinase [Streptacidiphilus anmyonensis]
MRGTWWDWLVGALVAACVGAGWLAAAWARERRARLRALGDRGWLLERERENAARAAVAAERARIARELHDIVSHNVSLMVVQASAAREVLTVLPDEAASALRAVEDAGRDTMTELRHLLGLLAPAQDGSEPEEDQTSVSDGPSFGPSQEGPLGFDGLGPQPGLDRLGSLVDRVSFAGVPVEVRILGTPRGLPAGVDVTAFRIVQEALTNALRHGDGGAAEVTVRYADASLRVEVLTTGSSVLSGGAAPAASANPGAGRGLTGLRERVAVYGGDLDARRRLGGGYRVRARIPLERA